MEAPQLKSNTNKVQLANKTEGVQATHSYSQDELDAFCEHVNFYLEDDEHCKDYVPITDHSKLFELVGDGILLCKLINKAQPGLIDTRAINLKKPLNIFKQQENLNLAITSAKSLGCKLVNITPQLIIDQREHIILGLTWQVIKVN
ncbi:Calponin homology domain [Pseudocohnilembus persalinus]|uniref:Calponin homology domain n=1 Tax=Pseudocohnilembus persalinus TaxID=266149 RepID=A0A0V0R2G8_PSEPJ|nr:Calponin homology domain [Pseudocohnilembus persalinus]|eukprot:KRX08464.1 Calponin homology domain [Pseudocohnilembus persalinus]